MNWSYSGIKLFEQCPRKYYHLREVGDYVDVPGKAAQVGTAFHKAAEEYVSTSTPLPAEFAYAKTLLDSLLNKKGTKHCELELGVKVNAKGSFEPCAFNDKDYWWRGIIDLLIDDGKKGFLVDYKTSKSTDYADTRQLDVLAGGTFLHFPHLEEIHSGLVFVTCKALVKKRHYAEHSVRYLNTFRLLLDRIEKAKETNTWNTRPSGLCGYCPVYKCEHNIRI